MGYGVGIVVSITIPSCALTGSLSIIIVTHDATSVGPPRGKDGLIALRVSPAIKRSLSEQLVLVALKTTEHRFVEYIGPDIFCVAR